MIRFKVSEGILLIAIFLRCLPATIPGAIFAKGDNSSRAVALTFDDGPGISTFEILDILKEYNAKATFFVIGKNARSNPHIVKRLVEEGHEIGNHTYSHPLKAAIAYPKTFTRELDSTQRLISNIVDINCRLFRPPHGWRTPWMMRECDKNGYKVIMWSLNSHDWRDKSHRRIAKRIFKKVEPGSIILLHDRLNTGKDKKMNHTVRALPQILDSLTRAGFSFFTISELLSLADNRCMEITQKCNNAHKQIPSIFPYEPQGY